MSYLGILEIDDYLTFYCNTHDPDTGVATDASAAPTYRVYEDETGTPILTGSMALLDTANTTGFYSERIQLTAANGFEEGKCYCIYITATVDSDTGTTHRTFQIKAAPATAAALTTVDTVVDAIKTVTDNLPNSGALSDLATILTDTGELQTDLVNGGRLDLLIDAIKAKTDNLPTDPADDSDIDAQLATIAAYLDTEIAAILTDTGELQTDWHDGGRLDLLIDAIITHLTDVKGATFAGATDSLEAIRNRGDAAWITGGAGDATEAKQDAIITDLDDVKGTGFVKNTDSLTDLAHTGADSDTLETLSDQIDDVVTLGTGAIEFTYTLTSSVDSTPVADADIWVTTSNDPDDNIVASGTTDQDGEVTFYLDAGTIYVWRQKSGWNFTNPDIEVVA